MRYSRLVVAAGGLPRLTGIVPIHYDLTTFVGVIQMIRIPRLAFIGRSTLPLLNDT